MEDKFSLSQEDWDSIRTYPQSIMELLRQKEQEQPQSPRYPKKYFSKKKAIIRLRKIGDDEIIQHEGLIYRLDKSDPSALALYGGHQVIVLNQELVDFEEWMIVSVTELW